jgi:hypothetical protein
MKVFLIILAVLILLVVIILSLSAEFEIVFDGGWTTKVRVLFIEKDIKLSQLLSFLVAPDKAGKEAAEKSKEKKAEREAEAAESEAEAGNEPQADELSEATAQKETEEIAPLEAESEIPEVTAVAEQEENSETQTQADSEKKSKKPAPAKKSPIQKIIDEDGIVGILLLVSNLIQTLNSAITTLIKGLHIYSLYVKMIIGGGGAADIAEKYGSVCGWYYPLKGYILNQMRVDNYDDLIQPDFIAPRSEYEFQFIGSISVGLLLRMLLKAGKTFLINYFKNK